LKNGGAFGVATDWGIYGFGQPKYNAVLKAAAQASKDNGIVMDYAIGPGNGQGVPATYNNRKIFELTLYSKSRH
jgi:hypothetical protein